jgi:hypothetical protein
MPTLSKPQLIEMPSVWQEPSVEMNRAVFAISEPALGKLGFYREHGQAEDFGGKFREQVQKHGHEVLCEIAGALTLAASISQSMSVPVLIATLKNVRKEPVLIVQHDFPGAVLWRLAGYYQRGTERPGTYWPDMVGEAPANYNELVEKPSPENISAAASRAIASLQDGQKLGRPRNFANESLAEKLGEIFLRYNANITRHSLESSLGRGRYYQIDGGPFLEFVEIVLEPLQAYLRENRFRKVSASGIVRHVKRSQSERGG